MSFPQLLEQARREIAAGVRPRLLVMGPGPQPYRTIFVGSPNWCGTIAPPLASWLSHYDFSGKVLFPFYSHCGGVRGDLRGAVRRFCPKAEVKEALGLLETETAPEDVLGQWLARNGVRQNAVLGEREAPADP